MMKRQIFLISALLLVCLSLVFVVDSKATEYILKKNDSLNSTSKEFGASAHDPQHANALKRNPSKAKQQVLHIAKENTSHCAVLTQSKPGSKSAPANYYTVKKGDNLVLIAKKTGVPLKQIVALNNVRPKCLRSGQKLFLAKATTSPAKVLKKDESILSVNEEDGGTGIETSEAVDLEKEIKKDAELLGQWGSCYERKLLVRVATGFLGAPYRWGGSTVRGIDCSAFVRKIYQFFDVNLPRTAREQIGVGLSINRDELVEGDLVFFRTRRPIGHVGIYVGNNEFVHASARSKVVRIDNLAEPYFQKRYVGAVRVKGLAEDGV